MFVLGFWEIKSGSKGENQMTSWNLYFLNFNEIKIVVPLRSKLYRIGKTAKILF